MIFRQLYDDHSSTYTYLLADEHSREAVIIDTVFEQHQRDSALINELNLKLIAVLDTHCHADHVTGAWLMAQEHGCKIASAKKIGASDVDVALQEGDKISFGDKFLSVRETPGHTDGCLTFVLDDESMAFTGDTLLIRGCGRSDFQAGDAAELYHSITDKIFSLPDRCLLYPAHDYQGRTVTSVHEEKQYNTRIGGGASERDFVGFMDAMKLPHPKQIDAALPANLKSGKPDHDVNTNDDWAPLHYTYSGIPEVTPEWVEKNLSSVSIIDVREEFEIEQGHDKLQNAVNFPLETLRDRLEEVNKQFKKDEPILCLCRSGRRSAMAVNILKQDGFERVANISGGIIGW